MRVSASFQIIPRCVGRLGLRSWSHVVGRLGPRLVGRLGSRVPASASFQIFASTALCGEGNCRRGNVRRICLRGEMSGRKWPILTVTSQFRTLPPSNEIGIRGSGHFPLDIFPRTRAPRTFTAWTIPPSFLHGVGQYKSTI